jgi:chemotaxis protein methyltransferase CheR
MLEKLLQELSINVTEMFRDPSFFRSIREEVIPMLQTYPFIKIWHAGCSTGEEVYSMAILLKEEGLYERCQIYATDFNHNVIQKAKAGIYSIENIRKYTANYQLAGGKASFSDYYTAQYNAVYFDPSLKKRITFAQHNLVTDGVFGEMNVIICRNVLIYFNQELQNRVISLFYESLSIGSFMCLGSRESLLFSDHLSNFSEFVEKEKIYQKIIQV